MLFGTFSDGDHYKGGSLFTYSDIPVHALYVEQFQSKIVLHTGELESG